MAVTLSFVGKESAFAAATAIAAELCEEQGSHFYETTTFQALQAETLKSHNVFLCGDNLQALKTFVQLNAKFHVIYIDPPYNSGSRLTYTDSMSSERWLSMLYPRLLLAQKILHEHGVMFLSIDDRESANLTVLMNEIFGIDNHIGTIKWRKKRKPSFLSKHISTVIEYILIFAKNKDSLLKLQGAISTETSRPVLNASNGLTKRILRKGTEAKCSDGTYLKGTYRNRTLVLELLEDAHVLNGKLVADVEVQGQFRVSQEVLDKSVFITKKFGLRRCVEPEEQVMRHATDDGTVDWETNEDAEEQLKDLFHGKKIFDFPKPVGLIKNLLKMYQAKDNELVTCLDFFAGSATLAQAIYELNCEEKNKKYSFCCVQNEEKIKNNSNNSELKTIADIAKERIKIVEERENISPKCQIYSETAGPQ